MMKQIFLVGGVIVVILVLIGSFAIVGNKKTSKAVISNSVQSEESVLPILEIFSGQVDIKAEGEESFIKGEHGQKVKVGSTIKTLKDSRAQLLYPNNSVVRLDQNSEMILEDFSDSPAISIVQITKGRIWSRVAKLLGKDDLFESKTETLVASVRGTSYGHGILADGSNKITVNKSKVLVDCIRENIPNIEVLPNKKVTTFCDKTLDTKNWGGDEASDEWFGWNIQEDKLLDSRFGGSTYDDQPSPTPSPTPKPTLKPTVTPTPAPKTATPTSQPPAQTNTSTVAPTQTPAPTATPNPPTISRFYDADCWANQCRLIIYGSEFYDVTSVNAYDSKGTLQESAQYSVKSSSQIEANFVNLTYGNYFAEVVTSSHGSVKSTNTFLANQLF